MEPMEAVQAAETALREAVRLALPGWKQAAGAPDIKDLEKKQHDDAKQRAGAVISDDLLAYTELRHLRELVLKNWPPFKPVFGDMDRTAQFFRVMGFYRNPAAHSRTLLPFERDLLFGITGLFRNQVALYRTAHQPNTAFYPVIESASDHFGNAGLESAGGFIYKSDPTMARLNVGDHVVFTALAWDPLNRPVTWILQFENEPSVQVKNWWKTWGDDQTGSSVTFEREVTREHVKEFLRIRLILIGSGEYHRYHGSYHDPDRDDVRAFEYAVNPPMT